jgi:signal transduction histidine kinase
VSSAPLAVLPLAPPTPAAAGLPTAQAPARGGRRAWGLAWPVLAAALVGAIALGAELPDEPALASDLYMLDLLLGLIAISLLPLRRSAPLAVAMAVTVCAGFSVFATGALAVAVISLATRRRWREIAAVAPVCVVAGIVGYRATRSVRPPVTDMPEAWWAVMLPAAILLYGAFVLVGLYIGGRRELLVTLRDRAQTAEREQTARVDQARITERTRIAREMHDVLAHRISLVALHSGALAYRNDLTHEETAGTARIIRDNAHLALTELRDVLGVLRDTDDAVVPDRPQPTLAALAGLIEECVVAGTPVTCNVSSEVTAALPGLPGQASRNAFRILQESLTNACKHATGLAVLVEIGGSPGGRLTLEVSNPVPDAAHGRSGHADHPPGSGLGLIGLSERARLAGGELVHGVDRSGRFTVRAWVPWPT